MDWSKAGVPGGIPNRTVVYKTFAPGVDRGADQRRDRDPAPKRQVVFLGAGKL
jgi:hypothetical protein